MDTALASGCYLDYWLSQDSTVMITWGTPQEGKIGAMESERWPGWAPHEYKCAFENYIALRYRCGSPCWSLTLLPKNPNDSIITLQEDLLRDTKRGYVFGNRCYKEMDSADFCLYDVNRRIHHPIRLPGLEWTSIEIVLDSCAFTDEGLYLQWFAHDNLESGFGEQDTVISIE
jgi:hypothetical protein